MLEAAHKLLNCFIMFVNRIIILEALFINYSPNLYLISLSPCLVILSSAVIL